MSAQKSLLLLCVPLLFLSACGSSENSEDSQTLRIAKITRNNSVGTIETMRVEYSESGNYLRDVTSQNGEIVLTRNFETTAEGRFIRRSDDTNQDGMEDRSSTYEYIDGFGLTRVFRIGANMLIESIEVFQFENGQTVSAEAIDIVDVATPELVDELSGTVTARFNYTYEENRLVEKSIDLNDDGVVDELKVFIYNPDGTLASTVNNSVTDGVISSATYAYEQGRCNTNFTNTVARYFCVTRK